MPIAGHLHKIVFGGPMAVSESWSCSVHYLSPVAGNLDLVFVKQDILQKWIDPSGLINGLAKLSFVKANEISPVTGKYLSAAAPNDVEFDPVDGANPTTRVPPQLTVALTTRASITRGRGHAGRFYLPTSMTGVDATGKLNAGQLTGFVTHWASMLSTLNTEFGGNCVIYSKIGQVANFITTLAVGDVVDTQRRRRKSLVEVYQAVPVNGPPV